MPERADARLRLGVAGLALLSLACGGLSAESPAPAPVEVDPMNTTASFTSTDTGLTSLLSSSPRLAAPASFPPDNAARADALTRKVPTAQARTHICPARFFTCKIDEERAEFFVVGHVDISPQAVGVVFLGLGDLDAPVVLITYAPSGEIVGGQIVGGAFGDMEYGYEGTLTAPDRLEVNRYVWFNGEEKEFVEDYTFQIRANGAVDRVIAL
ncbi:MAG: hypothetical protein AAFV53_02660 [Myxococcota bacterium]